MKQIFFYISIIFSISVFGNEIKFYGTAMDLKTGKFVYTDNHKEKYQNGVHVSSVISYKDSSGKEFANKVIEFTPNASVPNFTFFDLRDGYTEGGKKTGNAIKLFYRRKSTDSLSEKVLNVDKWNVLDGGFDYFVRENWENFSDERKISFEFLVPVELGEFGFRVYKLRDDVVLGREAIVLRMEIDNFIFRSFIRPITIAYDKKTKRILQYEGISNINDENGKSLNVKITYTYPNNVL